MTKKLALEDWQDTRFNWPSRYITEDMVNRLLGANEQDIVTDERVYPDRETARQVADLYRRRLRKHHHRRMQIRTVESEGGWQWFGRVMQIPE